jgi:ABC-type uncharacterized transport system substrate-binding protein
MMRRREFVTLLSGAAAWPLAARAQQPAKVHRIGYLSVASAAVHARSAAFWQVLRELGWVEGKNVVIDYRFADDRLDRLPDLAADLVRLQVDVIVAAAGTPPAVAAKNATERIPIVMIGPGDPVGLGLIASLAHPGGNVTGLSFSVGMETFGKALSLLKEAAPAIRRVAILSNQNNAAHSLAIRDIDPVARSLGVELQLLEARDPSEFGSAFAAITNEGAGALFVTPDSIFLFHRAWLADLAARNQLPSVHGYREHVEAGGLMSYGPNLLDLYRRAAGFVDKILKGAKPADLPVEQPTKFELVINLKTAKALGLTIPPTLLVLADDLIE